MIHTHRAKTPKTHTQRSPDTRSHNQRAPDTQSHTQRAANTLPHTQHAPLTLSHTQRAPDTQSHTQRAARTPAQKQTSTGHKVVAEVAPLNAVRPRTTKMESHLPNQIWKPIGSNCKAPTMDILGTISISDLTLHQRSDFRF